MKLNRHDETWRRQKGFTVIETVLATFLFSLLSISIYSLLNLANVFFRTSDSYGILNQNAMQILHYIDREIGQTSPVLLPSHLSISTDPNSNSIVRFQIPVDWDNDGDVVTTDVSNTVEWGAYDQAGQTQKGTGQNPFGRWAQYSVVNNQLIRQVLSGGLSPVAGLNRVVANNVTAFTATQNSNMVTTSITLQTTDNVGQSGDARTFQATFSHSSVLRNAVS